MHISLIIIVLRRFWRNFRVTKGGGILWEVSNGFLFRALISFSAHISWNNGFTAILTKFLPLPKREVFYEKIQFPNGFRFRTIISFLHISRETMVLRRFYQNFRVTKGGGTLWKESIPEWFSISKHNFVFCIYLVK